MMQAKIALLIIFIDISIALLKHPSALRNTQSNEMNYNELDEHTLVTDSNIFPYVVAILKMSSFLSTGALIDDNWVLTGADALFLIRESSRTLRVRLGSINYRKGGILLPVKYIEIHPNFDDNQPIYDLALIKLSQTIRFTPNIQAIRLQTSTREAFATHFIVASWPYPLARDSRMNSEQSEQLKSMEVIKRRRILSVTHLHPSDAEDCAEELLSEGIKDTDSMMCLDTGVMMDPCMRDVGAPVVLNDLLWGIVSSWKPPDCEDDLAGPSFVSLVSSPNISSWIQATTQGNKWR